MPICPKCGKQFSTEQALQYHLNKKYKCGTWKCGKCNIVFNTQFDLKIHKMSCEKNIPQYVPSYDILCEIYNCPNLIFVERDNSGVVHSVSPGYSAQLGKGENPVGKLDSSLVLENGIFRTNANGDMIECTRIDINEKISVDIVV